MNTADFDQMHAASKELVGLLKMYYELCLSTGFSEAQALQLTISMQDSMLRR